MSDDAVGRVFATFNAAAPPFLQQHRPGPAPRGEGPP